VPFTAVKSRLQETKAVKKAVSFPGGKSFSKQRIQIETEILGAWGEDPTRTRHSLKGLEIHVGISGRNQRKRN
jgi:hypothetical protein